MTSDNGQPIPNNDPMAGQAPADFPLFGGQSAAQGAGPINQPIDLGTARVYDPSTDVSNRVEEARQAGMVSQDSLSEAAKAANAAAATAVSNAVRSGKRAIIAPVHKNHNFLIKGGIAMAVYPGTSIPVAAGVPVQGGAEVARVGDVRVKFTGGIAILDPNEPDFDVQIAWVASHPDICRDISEPGVEIWASLKEGQMDTMYVSASMPKALNVDAIMRGDFSSFAESGSLAGLARQMLATHA